MKAKPLKAQTAEEVSGALAECIADGFTPTLAIAFLSISQDRMAICQCLSKAGIAVFGATSAGEFIDDEIGEGAVVLMLLDLDPVFFAIRLAETAGRSVYEVAKEIGETGKQMFANPAFLVTVSGFGTNGENVVNGIEDVMDAGAVVFGAIAGDDLTGSGSFVFTHDVDSRSAMLALIIDSDQIIVKGVATSGWKPIGTKRIITHSQENIVYTIDDVPALDVLVRYLNDRPTGQRMEGNTQLLDNNAYFPILLHRENAPPIVRAAVRTDPAERSVHFAGPVPKGASFRFAMPPDFNVIDEVIAQAEAEIKEKQLPEADALILFSCISRKIIFGPMVSEEVGGLKKIWNAPLVGFFSYGEIGRAAYGSYEFHNNTCCLVAMKER